MIPHDQDEKFLRLALQKAEESVARGGFPAGAVVVKNGDVIGTGISVGNILNDPTSHGEMAAIRQACSNLQTTDLSKATLYASMQPCVMCFGAALWSGISRIVFACPMEDVPSDYYGGTYRLQDINAKLLSPLQLVPVPALAPEALRIIRAWDQTSQR